jgi:heptosyltransferase-1
VKILIVRLGALGDIVHALPAETALRAAHPDATVDHSLIHI